MLSKLFSLLFSLFKKKEAEAEEAESVKAKENNSDVITNAAAKAAKAAAADDFDEPKPLAELILEAIKRRELQKQQSNDFSEISSTDYTSNTRASNNNGLTDIDVTVADIIDDDEAQSIIQKLQKQISNPINYRSVTPAEMFESPLIIINSLLINNNDVILYYKTELVRDAKSLKSWLDRINSFCYLDISEDIHYLLCDDTTDIPFIDLCLLQYRFSNLYDFIGEKNKSSFWYVRAMNNLDRIDPSRIANGSIYTKSLFMQECSVEELNAKISNAYADLGEMLLFRYVDFPFNAFASYKYFVKSLQIRSDNILAIRMLGSLLYNMVMESYKPYVYAGGHNLNSQEFKQLFDMSDTNSDNKDMVDSYLLTRTSLDSMNQPLLDKTINILEHGVSFNDPLSTGMLADLFASSDIYDGGDDDKARSIANRAISLGDPTGCGFAALIKTDKDHDYELLEQLAHKLISLPNAFPSCKADAYYTLGICYANRYQDVKRAIDCLNTSLKLYYRTEVEYILSLLLEVSNKK